MLTCPKCGYLRQPGDDEFFSMLECPRCGIVYQKFEKEQQELEAAKLVVYVEKPNTNRAYLWGAVVLLFVIGIFMVASKGVKYPVGDHAYVNGIQPRQNPQAGLPRPEPAYSPPVTYTPPPPQNHQTGRGLQTPGYNLPVIRTTPPALKDSSREISNAAQPLTEAFNQPMDSSCYYKNELDESEWDRIKSLPDYAKIRSIALYYHRQHTYVGNDWFVCLDMAMEVWDLLGTAGIRSRLMVGNVQTDITQSETIVKYLAAMNHAWVLAEVAPSTWIAVETTGGFIAQPSMWNYGLYNTGAMFDNPGQLKDFNESRKSMFQTCSQIVPMQSDFNRSYAGRPVSTEGAQYTGRIIQKIYDCKNLVGRVTTHLRRN